MVLRRKNFFFFPRFQGQTELYGRKPSGLRLAIEEAFLAEHGFLGGKFDATSTFGQPAKCDYSVRGGEETSCSDHDEDSLSHIQVHHYFLVVVD